MNMNPVLHSTFAIDRNYPVAPSRVFAAFANGATKRRWFSPGKGPEVLAFTLDFRVGGREQSRYRFEGGPPGAPPPGTEMCNDTLYQDIVPDQRIVFAYTMAIGDKRISASLGTVELVPEAKGTRLMYTEQAAFFDGADGPTMREAGWRGLFQNLDDELRRSG
jgi:uncharacterized protein YndB with AHSA1/START domain